MKSFALKLAALAVLATALSGCIVIVKDDQPEPMHHQNEKVSKTNQA